MPVAIKPDGHFEVIYSGPFTGINVMMPENMIPDTATPASNDFIFRNAELRSRPNFLPLNITPDPTHKIAAMGSLKGVLWAILGIGGLYTYNFGTGMWTLVAGSAASLVTNWRIFNNVLYITDSQSGKLASWDGTTFTASIAIVAGQPVGGVFIDELDNHLLMANMNEVGGIVATRLRWAATSLPAVWDPTVNVNAGFNDFLDVPDAITGLMMLGRSGYILRSDGITEISPTGQGVAPFQFNHLWANQLGLGNTKFFALDTYGNTGILLARDNVYSVSSYDIQPIGGMARDAILTDIANTITGSGVLSNVIGVITPYPRSGIVTDSGIPPTPDGADASTFPYLIYQLFVNKPGNSIRAWTYSFEGSYWEQYNIPGYILTGKPALAIDSTGAPTILLPVLNTGNNQSTLARFDALNFNDAAQGSSHTFRAEDVAPGRQVTVNRIVLTYRDLGAFTITLTIKGSNDNGVVTTATQVVTLGGISDSQLKTVMLYPVDTNGRSFTGFRPQLTISRAANGGPVSIVMVQMLGQLSTVELD